MPVYSDIQQALETKLNSMAAANSYAVAWPNTPYEPDTEPYLRAFTLPAETAILGLTAGSGDDYKGIYQVDVVVKKGTGNVDSRAMVDAIENEFSKVSSQTVNTTTVVIQKAWASGAFDIDSAWQSIPVSISYRAIA